jgi:hypothetical protein
VAVRVADPQPDDRIKVALSAGGKTVQDSAPAAGGVVLVDASGLPDGPVDVSAWVVDSAGNPSDQTQGAPFTLDTVAPAAATDVQVAAGPGNPVGYVNAASAAAVSVTATFAAATDESDSVVVVVGSRHIRRLGGLSSYTVGPFDLTDRPDGPLPLEVDVTDAAGNTSTFTGSGVKDTSAPEAPASFGVPAGPDNPADFINADTEHNALFEADFPDGVDPGATVTASVGGLDLGQASLSDVAATWRADVSGLPDGTLALQGTITDAAGNSTTFSGQVVKETEEHVLNPISAHVSGCPPDTITPRTAADVHVLVVFPDEPGLHATVTVTLTDSAGNTTTASASGAREVVVVSGLDASAFVAGPVQVQVTVTDAAGNTVSFAGTPATMFT